MDSNFWDLRTIWHQEHTHNHWFPLLCALCSHCFWISALFPSSVSRVSPNLSSLDLGVAAWHGWMEFFLTRAMPILSLSLFCCLLQSSNRKPYFVGIYWQKWSCETLTQDPLVLGWTLISLKFKPNIHDGEKVDYGFCTWICEFVGHSGEYCNGTDSWKSREDTIWWLCSK